MLKFQESDQKASEICPESEIESLGPWDGSTPEQLSAQINRMNQRLHRENQQFVFLVLSFSYSFTRKETCDSKPHASTFVWCRFSESIDDLRMMYEKLERKIAKKRKLYQGYREKLMVEPLQICLC